MSRRAPRQLRLRRRVAGLGVVTAAALLASSAAAAAHPLGNFTTNTFAGLTVSPGGVAVDYVVDLAELPTLRASRELDGDRDGRVSTDEVRRGGVERCTGVARSLRLTLDGRTVPLAVEDAALAFAPGQAGLRTLRLECRLAANAVVDAPVDVSFRDDAFPDRRGWREIVAVGDGATLTAADVPATSLSDRLRAYPDDRLASPLRVLRATLSAAPGGAPATQGGAGAPESAADGGPGRGVDPLTASFTALVAERDLTPLFALFALLAAVVLGAAHALAPGHGKTVMAAYVVGERGTLRQALAIGLTVAVTHTAGVVALGVALSVSDAVAPAGLYPWFGLVSGALIMTIGVGLLRRALRGWGHAERPTDAGTARPSEALTAGRRAEPGARDLVEAAGSPTTPARPTATAVLDHDDHGHPHAPTSAGGSGEGMRRRGLLTLGFAGGLAPSPSALVVLLGALALGRAAFGVALVVAYGVGLAATLVGAGLVLLRFRDVAERWLTRRGGASSGRIARALPVATSALVVLGGLVVAARGFALG